MEKRKAKTANTSGVIFPPPFIYLASIIAGIIANFIWKIKIFSDAAMPRIILGIAAILIAMSIFANAFKMLKNAKTPIQPYKPTLKIVKSGPYGFSRNPVYLSFLLVQTGIATLLNNLWILIALVPAIILIHYGAIIREEKYLEGKFGKEYLNYKKAVRRWI